MLSEMGINVVESEDAEEADEGEPARPPTKRRPKAASSSRPAGRAPVATRALRARRPHRRSGAHVSARDGLGRAASREGEIAIAKRIEAGREAMIAGLCESPLTFQAIIIWRDELNDGKVLLRDIIDLEATYAGPDGKKAPKIDYDGAGAPPPPNPARDRRRRRPRRARRRPGSERRRRRRGADPEDAFEDEDDMENSVSLSAMEAELKPKVLETFDRIADAYKKLRRLQDQNVENKLRNETLTPAQERKYKTLKKEIVADVKSLSLNQNRIDALVEQLYDINKRLIGLETGCCASPRLIGVAREDFLKNYQNSELDPKWLLRVSKLGDPRLEGVRRQRQGRRSRKSARRDSVRWRPRPGSKSRNSAASSRWCRRASARRARRRRKWSRPICASSSRSPRNTPTAACNSST